MCLCVFNKHRATFPDEILCCRIILMKMSFSPSPCLFSPSIRTSVHLQTNSRLAALTLPPLPLFTSRHLRTTSDRLLAKEKSNAMTVRHCHSYRRHGAAELFLLSLKMSHENVPDIQSHVFLPPFSSFYLGIH